MSNDNTPPNTVLADALTRAAQDISDIKVLLLDQAGVMVKTADAFDALFLISASEGGISPGALSQQMSARNPSYIIASLKKNGLIAKVDSNVDKRSKRLYLTEDGKGVVEKLRRPFDVILNEVFGDFSVDQKELLETLGTRHARATAESAKDRIGVFYARANAPQARTLNRG